jgi:hypothetical protein
MEILGLLDALESLILDGFKIPLSKKIMVDEEKVLAIIDKVRLVAQGGSGFAKAAISGEVARGGGGSAAAPAELAGKLSSAEGTTAENKAVDVMQQAYQIAKEVRTGADKYADEVLTNLEATAARVLRAIKAGRERLSKSIGVDEVESMPRKEAYEKNNPHA